MQNKTEYVQIIYHTFRLVLKHGMDVVCDMQKKEVKNIGLRVTPEIHRKLRYIAKYEGRTINGQAHYLIMTCIREFEKENGPITEEDLK